MIFLENALREKHIFPELFPLFKGPGRAHMDPETPKNIRKQIALLGAFKGPCTLP